MGVPFRKKRLAATNQQTVWMKMRQQLLQIYSEGSTSSDVQAVKKSGQRLITIREEEEMEVDQPPTVELQKSLPSTSAGVKSTCTTSATHSAAETSAGDSAIESHKPTLRNCSVLQL